MASKDVEQGDPVKVAAQDDWTSVLLLSGEVQVEVTKTRDEHR